MNASFPEATYTPGPTIDPASEPKVSHFENFIAAVRSRKVEDLRCDIAEGHLSTTLAQLATISYRLGRKLVFNPETETITGDAEANQLLTREYRKPYALPDKVQSNITRYKRNDRMSNMAIKIIERFWELMMTNDFRSVGSVLSDEFVLEWPQSKERIHGRDNFAAMNEEYPRHGRWEFTINRIVGNDDEAVSDVWVTDGVQKARAISFFSVRDGRIVEMVEFWPGDYPAPENRKHLVEKMDS